MSHYFRLSFRLFDPVFHGRGDRGVLEWPPSPMRAFQALVAAAGQRWRNDRQFDAHARDPLTWLQGLGSPDLIAPVGVPSSAAYRLYVPNNHTDIAAAAWSSGDALASIAEHRVEKDVRSTRLIDGDTVQYLWPITPDRAEHIRVLNGIAREVTHLGWGIDQVAASVSIVTTTDAGRLVGERWIPTEQSRGVLLRVPRPAGPVTAGTLADLRRKHADFNARLGPSGFKPVPPLSAFRVVGYRRVTEVLGAPYVAFKLLHPDSERLASLPATYANYVAAMTRHATATAANQQPREWIDSYVHGHRSIGEDTKPRFSYVPLPTIGHRGEGRRVVGGIRRTMVAEFANAAESCLRWARQMLPGQLLIEEERGRPRAMLVPLDEGDWVLRQYTAASDSWATVTPVVLPGSDDGRFAKAEKLFLKALRHAGYSTEALAEFEFLKVCFWPGGDLALKYERPAYLKATCWSVYHMRLRWKQPVKGPLAIGAGRHCGLGVFAAMNT